MLTIYTSHERKDVPFWGIVDIAVHFGGHIPRKTILGARVCIFTTDAQSVKIFILLKLLH